MVYKLSHNKNSQLAKMKLKLKRMSNFNKPKKNKKSSLQRDSKHWSEKREDNKLNNMKSCPTRHLLLQLIKKIKQPGLKI